MTSSAVTRSAAGKPEAQGILAREVTELVHGEQGWKRPHGSARHFSPGDIAVSDRQDFEQLELDGLPCTSLADSRSSIVAALVAAGLAKSNRQAREFLGNHAVSVNGQVVDSRISS